MPFESPLRVSVRPDFDALDVRSEGPARTPDGRAWVRWSKEHSGWYAIGARKPKLTGRSTFWDAVFSVACACGGGNVDQAHCCGPGILALGGLGVTMRSGYAQLLLHTCLLANPARYVEVMSRVIKETGAVTRETSKSPSGVALMDPLGGYFVTEEDLRLLILLRSDSVSWNSKQKERARIWVSTCSELLRDETMDAAQQAFAQEIMPALLGEETKRAIHWPESAPTDWWQYTGEQQMLWALTLVMALADDQRTESLVLGAAAASPEFYADGMLRQIALDVRAHETSFRMRYENASGLLRQLLRVEQ